MRALESSVRGATPPGALAAVIALAVVAGPGCYLAHERGASVIEIGGGLDGFEPLPREGGVARVVPHPRGGFGVALSVRLRELDPLEAAITCAVADPATGDLLAAPRSDEPHRFTREGTEWISSGTIALFGADLEPSDLDGSRVRLEATLVTRGGDAFADSRHATLVASDE